MICVTALIVFGVLGIFSATHRETAKEALDCVLRKATFRKCRSDLDKRLRGVVVGKFMKSPKISKFVHKHFSLLSLLFLLALVTSLVFSGIGVYNLVRYGSCEPHSTTCVFNPGELTCGSQHCADNGCDCEEGCEPPEFEGCEGSCDCEEQVCS